MSEFRLFGLIGHPLGHSFSSKFFQKKFQDEGLNCEYRNFDLAELEGFKNVLSENPNLCGLNVTVPHKQKILDYLDEVDTEAGLIGAVNTISINDGKLIGFNTDHIAFTESLTALLTGREKRAMILGAGGASRAVAYALKNIGIDYTVVIRKSRMEGINFKMLNERMMEDHLLIINTTPLGTFPDIAVKPPIPYLWLSKDHILYDLVYNPEVTTFMQEGLNRSCKVKNGYEMLVRQAELSWEIWNR